MLDAVSLPIWQVFAHGQKLVAYGFGWMIYFLGNNTVLMHGGSTDGMQTVCAIVPEEQLGIAIFTNQQGHLGAFCLLNLLLDKFLDQPPVLWHQKALVVFDEMSKSITATRKKLEQERGHSQPTFSIKEYVGLYEHPAYGSIWIREENGHLTVELWTHEKGNLQPWDKDRFEITDFPEGSPLPMLIDFEISPKTGKVSGLTFPDYGFFGIQG